MHPIRTLVLLLLVCLAAGLPAFTAEKETRVFEMRTYTAPPGKLDALLARFRDHTLKLFAKHGMTSVGYWVPAENPQNQLVYLLAYPNREAAEKAWAAFRADPDWLRVRKETEANGAIVAKVESVFLTPTDYSPSVQTAAGAERTFEMRVYLAAPDRLDALNARFRDHTLKLFAKHGMTNVGYWMPSENPQRSLVYLLAHRSPEAAKASWDAFRQDPDWLAARKASEERAGGSLTAAGGVKSVYLKPTDFSPMR